MYNANVSLERYFFLFSVIFFTNVQKKKKRNRPVIIIIMTIIRRHHKRERLGAGDSALAKNVSFAHAYSSLTARNVFNEPFRPRRWKINEAAF